MAEQSWTGIATLEGNGERMEELPGKTKGQRSSLYHPDQRVRMVQGWFPLQDHLVSATREMNSIPTKWQDNGLKDSLCLAPTWRPHQGFHSSYSIVTTNHAYFGTGHTHSVRLWLSLVQRVSLPRRTYPAGFSLEWCGTTWITMECNYAPL